MELLKIVPSASNDQASVSQQVEALRDRLGSALRIANQLAGPQTQLPAERAAVDGHYVRKLLQLRRGRDRFFAGELFADPAWDILLELYAAALGQFRVSVSQLCVGAAVPPTTALRWIKQLEHEGLIARRSDPTDGRRQFLELTDRSFDAMNGYFRTVPMDTPVI